MTTDPQIEDDRPDESAGSVQDRLDKIGGSLMETIESDERFQSGVPKNQRALDLDFIQMTGLTRPLPKVTSPPLESALLADIDSSHPVNFFERGVQDVDHTLDPSSMEAFPVSSPAPATSTSAASPALPPSADALRKITSDLEEAGDLFEADIASPSALPDDESAPRVFSEGPDVPEFEDTLSKLLSELHEPEEPRPAIDESEESTSFPEMPQSAPVSEKHLVEAEQLLQELEHQPRETYAGDVSSNTSAKNESGLHRFEWQDPGPPKPDADAEAEQESERRLVYDYSASPTKRRTPQGHVSRQRKKILRAILVLIVLAASATGGYLGYRHYIGPTFMLPDELIALATSQMEAGNYRSASQTYAHFAARYPDNPYRSEAQFNAAFALRSVQAKGPEAQQLLKKSLELFQDFIKNNPRDVHRARAETIAGIIQFELGNYAAAIDVLRSPDRLAEDPGASLPILRTLAAAYRKMGDFEHAESTYLQAAVHPKNYRADVDYYEAGDMMRERANLTEDKAEKEKLFDTVLDYWFKATHVINIDPGTREEIEKQIDRMKTEMRTQGMRTPEDPADPGAAAQATAASDLFKEPAPASSPVESSPTTSSDTTAAPVASNESPTESATAATPASPDKTTPAAKVEENKAPSKEPAS